MKCIKCGASCFDVMLHRTGPVGQDPEWMCMPCINKHEPELAKNLKSEPDFKVVEDIEKIVISNNHSHD